MRESFLAGMLRFEEKKVLAHEAPLTWKKLIAWQNCKRMISRHPQWVWAHFWFRGLQENVHCIQELKSLNLCIDDVMCVCFFVFRGMCLSLENAVYLREAVCCGVGQPLRGLIIEGALDGVVNYAIYLVLISTISPGTYISSEIAEHFPEHLVSFIISDPNYIHLYFSLEAWYGIHSSLIV